MRGCAVLGVLLVAWMVLAFWVGVEIVEAVLTQLRS